MVPLKLFFPSPMKTKLERRPISDGIDPVNELSMKLSDSRFDKTPIELGMLPIKFCSRKSSCTTTPQEQTMPFHKQYEIKGPDEEHFQEYLYIEPNFVLFAI